MEELKQFEREFFELSSLEKKHIKKKTGCLLPCWYTEYQVVDESIIMPMNSSILDLHLATTTVLVKTEVLVYPFSSLIAEFGGALGLFLGFSFMMTWDILTAAFQINFKRKCYSII